MNRRTRRRSAKQGSRAGHGGIGNDGERTRRERDRLRHLLRYRPDKANPQNGERSWKGRLPLDQYGRGW